MEYWKPIRDYEGLYEVSDCGRVRNSRTGRILKLRNNKGYIEVTLKGRTYLVHRLVAEAFIPNIDNLPCVDHIDTNKENNVYTNLRWVTHKGNMNNELTKERLSKAHKGKQSPQKGKSLSEEHKKKLSESHKKKVYCIELDETFNSVKEASEILGLDDSSISACCRKLKSTHGYHFIYVD